MVLPTVFLHACPALHSNANIHGDRQMRNEMRNLMIALIAVMGLSSTAYAGCDNAKFAGTWEVTFSDGNSCRLLLDIEGNVVASESTCYDPFRGATAPDSGDYAVAEDCSIEAAIVVEGVDIELFGQFSNGRNIGAGRYLVPAYYVKGGYTMVRVP